MRYLRLVKNFLTRYLPFRIRYGFWPQDVWSLDMSCSQWLLPRLRWLRDNAHIAPDLDDEDRKRYGTWTRVMDEMILAHEHVANGWTIPDFIPDLDDNRITMPMTPLQWGWVHRSMEETDRANRGILLFAKYYGSLWD